MNAVRSPIQLHMPDVAGCATAITAQVLYMFGIEPNMPDLTDIDQRIGRDPHLPCRNGGHGLEMLRWGLNLTHFSPINEEKALARGGYSYVYSVMSAFNEEWARHFSPMMYQARRDAMLAVREEELLLPGRRVHIEQMPQVLDIVDLLAAVPAVMVSTWSPWGAAHLMLAYGVNDQGLIRLYDPQEEGNTLIACSPIELNGWLNPIEGFVGISF